MTSPFASQGPVPQRTGLLLAVLSVIAASGWLISRVFIGLDFTDEMQYYGEIASLVRTGKFFQDDLFIQQLGYVFLWPFFKLHALVFPEQDYLLLFGRLLLLSGYGLAGLACWRAGTRLGFSTPAKLAGLAALIAWVPFQIFAPSYNTLSYLLIVPLAAGWLTRNHMSQRRYLVSMAGWLTALTYTYPPAGLVLIALGTAEAAWRQGFRHGIQLAGATLAGGLLVLGIIMALQPAFITELLTAVEFSRTFSVGYAMQHSAHMIGWAGFLLACGVFLTRSLRPSTFSFLGFPDRPGLRGTMLVGLIIGGAVFALQNRVVTFLHFAGSISLLMLVAASLPAADAKMKFPRARWLEGLEGLLLASGGLAILILGGWSSTGYFGVTLQMVLMIVLAAAPRPGNAVPLAGLTAMAIVLGTAFALSSGNGLHNFGIGVAALTPFFTLFAVRALSELRLPPIAGQIAPAVLTVVIILNGFSTPYRERHGWTGFEPVRGVPAFKGVWTSPLKRQVLQSYAELAGGFGTLKGKTVFVAGPHPWMYFASGGVPLTPMLFLHFTGGPKVDEFVAQRVFLRGEPDVVIITNTVPSPLHAQVSKWIEQGCTAQKVALPAGFNEKYFMMVPYELSPELLLLRRAPRAP